MDFFNQENCEFNFFINQICPDTDSDMRSETESTFNFTKYTDEQGILAMNMEVRLKETESTNFESGELFQQMDNKIEIETPTFTQREEVQEMTESTEQENTQSVSSPKSNIFDLQEDLTNSTKSKPDKPSNRKKADDGMRKKFKTRMEDRILELINTNIAKRYPRDKEVLFKKLPQNYLKDPSIYINKMCLDMTIAQRYQYDFGDESKKKLIHNCRVLKVLQERYGELDRSDSILKIKVKDLIWQYISSEKYDLDLGRIKRDDGEKYASRFNNVIKGDDKTLSYVVYFLTTPGNKKKEKSDK
jgi:hypothetical protein